MSILAGVEEIVSRHLGAGDPRSPSSRQRPQNDPDHPAVGRPSGSDALRLLEEAYERMTDNLERSLRTRAWRPSAGNWRFEKQLAASSHDATVETTLERAIASATGPDWANGVPVAAGLTDSPADERRTLDLVYRREARCYDLIELRVDLGSPFQATSQILQHGLLYLLARQHYPPWERGARDLLLANEVHLRVLAPIAFYAQHDLAGLEADLDASLPAFSAARLENPVIASFAFEVFPPEFRWPAARHGVVEHLLRRRPVCVR